MSQQIKQNPKKHSKLVTEVDDFGRKKFTLKQNDSADQVEQQQQKFIDTGKYASTLVGREEKIDIEKYIGKLEGNKKKKKTQVFYCQICKIGFKCDLAYITHINSPSHNRKLGMNMKVQAVSIQTVAQKIAKLTEQKNKSKQQKILQKKYGKNWQTQIKKREHPPQNNKNRVQNNDQNKKQHKQLADQQKKQPKNEKQQPKQVQQQEQQQEDPDEKMMRQLGLPTSFGSKKQKY